MAPALQLLILGKAGGTGESNPDWPKAHIMRPQFYARYRNRPFNQTSTRVAPRVSL